MLITKGKAEESAAAFMKNLYQTYARLMYATALRSVPSGQDCEDVVQDAVESLCRKVHTLMALPSPALTVYIVHTVKNKAGNFNRHQGVVNRHVTPLAGARLEELESPVSTPEELAEQSDALYRVWRRLPERDRELLYRKYVLRQDNEELAEFLHCKPDSVRTRLARVRKKAAALMEGDDGNDRTRTLA